MEETLEYTRHPWSYGLLKNGVCVAPEQVRSSLEMGDEQELLIRVQGMSVRLWVYGEPVSLAPYLVYRSPDIAGETLVREYEGAIAGYYFRIASDDADVDIDLFDRDGSYWRGICTCEEDL